MITDPIQTQRALLTWQSPLGGSGSRNRYAVGELVADGTSARFTYLTDNESFRAAQAEGFEGYPGLPLGASHSDDALQILRRRLPQADRDDFKVFLTTFGLSPTARFHDLTLLAYTGARLVSDSFGVSETFDGFGRPFQFIFDVAGFRHYLNNVEGVKAGDPICLVADPTNKHDSNAVCVVRDGERRLGFINRLQSQRVLEWLRADAIRTEIFRLNGRPQYPRLFILASIHPSRLAAAA